MPPTNTILSYSIGICLIIGIIMVIVGGVYLSKGNALQSYGCETQKDTSLSSDDMTRKVSEIEYEQCISSAGTQINWSRIVLIIGSILTVLGIAGIIYKKSKQTK